MPSFPDYMEAVFSELCGYAHRPDLIGKLRTEDLPGDRKQEQFDKLKRLKRYDRAPLRLLNSRFVVRFRDGDDILLCIQTEGVTGGQLRTIEDKLEYFEVFRTIIDESTFLFIVYQFRPYYRIKTELRQRDAAENVLAIADDDVYIGHEIDDLVKMFTDIAVFKVSRDSVLANCSEWYIAALLSISSSNYRSELVGDDLAGRMRSLHDLGNVNPENIYYALTSYHWKHTFIELYKCLEAVYYLPWIIRLKERYGYSELGLALSSQFRDALKWREKESESIEAIFDLLDDDLVMREELASSLPFQDLNFTEIKKSAVGRRIYKIRNFLVHQEDYEDPTPVRIDEAGWTVLVDFMLAVVESVYKNYGSDVGFSFLITEEVGVAA